MALRRTFSRIFLLMLVVFSAGCCCCTNTKDNSNTQDNSNTGTPDYSVKFYQNTQHHFTMNYPASWEKRETTPNVIVEFMSPIESANDKARAIVSVGILDLSPYQGADEVTVQEYYDHTKDENNGLTNYGSVSETQITLNGIPAIKHIFTFSLPAGDLENMQITLLKNQKVYVINYLGRDDKYSKFLDDANSMIDSFRVTG